jgi:SNF2 family DNA or RNA helicase
LFLCWQGLNGILADEMGLGKTIQAMAFLAHLAEVCKLGLVLLTFIEEYMLHHFLNNYVFLTGEEYLGSIFGGCSCLCAE